MTRPRNPNANPSQSAHAEELNARARRRAILSMKYVMKHMPEPCVNSRSTSYVPHTFPAQHGLCGERTLTAKQVQEMTMMIVVRNNCGQNIKLSDTYSVTGFHKAIRDYMPNGLLLHKSFDKLLSEERTNPDIYEAAQEYEAWVESYLSRVQVALATMYVEVGDKYGKAYLEVLSRRFRESWSTQQQVSFKGEVKAEEKVDATINFNFTTVPAKVEPPHGC